MVKIDGSTAVIVGVRYGDQAKSREEIVANAKKMGWKVLEEEITNNDTASTIVKYVLLNKECRFTPQDPCPENIKIMLFMKD